MKLKLIYFITVLFLIASCGQEKEKKQKIEKSETSIEKENVNSDVETDKKIDDDLASLKDLKCGDCSKICCSACTADGDRSRCAKTKFSKCSSCNHSSSIHYPVNH